MGDMNTNIIEEMMEREARATQLVQGMWGTAARRRSRGHYKVYKISQSQ